jgi:hypothetical protein
MSCHIAFYSLLLHSIPFYLAWFYSVPFISFLLYSTMFHSTLYCHILLHSLLFHSAPLYSTLFCSFLFKTYQFSSLIISCVSQVDSILYSTCVFCSILFCFFSSGPFFCTILFCSVYVYSLPFIPFSYSTQLFPIPSHSILPSFFMSISFTPYCPLL